MSLDSHTNVKTLEFIHFHIMDELRAFENRMSQRASTQNLESTVWPLFSAAATLAVALLQWRLIAAAFAFPFVYHGVIFIYRRSVRWWTERRPPVFDPKEIRNMFDKRTTNELLLAYSLVKAVESNADEPRETDVKIIYIAEAVYYLKRVCSDISKIVYKAEEFEKVVDTGGEEVYPTAIDGYRMAWAVQLLNRLTARINDILQGEDGLMIASPSARAPERKGELPSGLSGDWTRRGIGRDLAFIQQSYLPGFRKALTKLGLAV